MCSSPSRYGIYAPTFPGFESLSNLARHESYLLVPRTYRTREAADDILERYERQRIRLMGLEKVWIAPEDVLALEDFCSRAFPDHFAPGELHWLSLEGHARQAERRSCSLPWRIQDVQLDEVIRMARIRFGQVVPLHEDCPRPIQRRPWGDPQLPGEWVESWEPEPWPPRHPAPTDLTRSYEEEEVAWDWVLSESVGCVPRREARRRIHLLRLSWTFPLHRAMVAFAPSYDGLDKLLPDWVRVYPDQPWTLR
ncbi:MAG: hypothetical protein AAGA48_18710 [Myxococcota bacterium]